MAVINYDTYYPYQDNQIDYWPSGDASTQVTFVNYSMNCPHCNVWINNYIGFQYCPYCGKSLLFPIDKKKLIIDRLDTILKEVEDIKKELTK